MSISQSISQTISHTLRARLPRPVSSITATIRPFTSTRPHGAKRRPRGPKSYHKHPRDPEIISITNPSTPIRYGQPPKKKFTAAPALIRNAIPKGPSQNLIHYIPPSNPVREKLGPGMCYTPAPVAGVCSSTPIHKNTETEYLYTLMLRQLFSKPIAGPGHTVTLKFAINRCIKASGSHNKATASRLRKGFLMEALGTTVTKKKAYVCDRVRAETFDWDLHEGMRVIKGHMFDARDLDYYTPAGQVFDGFERPESEVATAAAAGKGNGGEEQPKKAVSAKDMRREMLLEEQRRKERTAGLEETDKLEPDRAGAGSDEGLDDEDAILDADIWDESDELTEEEMRRM